MQLKNNNKTNILLAFSYTVKPAKKESQGTEKKV